MSILYYWFFWCPKYLSSQKKTLIWYLYFLKLFRSSPFEDKKRNIVIANNVTSFKFSSRNNTKLHGRKIFSESESAGKCNWKTRRRESAMKKPLDLEVFSVNARQFSFVLWVTTNVSPKNLGYLKARREFSSIFLNGQRMQQCSFLVSPRAIINFTL